MQLILIYFILLHNFIQCILNSSFYCATPHNILIFIVICLILLHNMTQYSHLSSSSFCFTKEKKLANFCIQNFSFDVHFVFKFWAYNKTVFWEDGVPSIFST